MAKKKRSQAVSKRKLPRQSTQRQKTPTWVWLAGGGAILVVLVVGLLYIGFQGQTSTALSSIEGLVIFPDPGRQHVEGDIDYGQLVPPGGSHNPTWLNCGIFDEPVRPENVLHSMEHGAVWLAYKPDLPADQVEVLRDLVRQERSRRGEPLLILAPYPDLDTPIVATAWRAQLEVEDAGDERLQAFVDRFQRGPFTPEPGASCAFGGVMN
jgi:hypothetical protein